MINANPLHPPVPTKTQQKITWGNLFGASVGLALSSLIAETKQPIVIIASDTLAATRLEYELLFFNHDQSILHFPDWETLPYDHFSPHQDIVSERIAALYRMPSMKQGAIITSIATLMQKLPPRDFLSGQTFLLNAGDKLDLQILREQLVKAGYLHVDQVREHGEFVVRGSIIDIYPMGSSTPYRIDLFDDEIETIRTFSPETQLSQDIVNKIELLPAKEFPLTDLAIEKFRQSWRERFSGNPLNSPIYQDISEGICSPGIEYYFPLFFDTTNTIFDYLPANTLFVQIGNTHAKSEEFWNEVKARYEQRRHDISRPLLSPETLYLRSDAILNLIKSYSRIQILNEATADFNFSTESPPIMNIDHKAQQPLQALENFLLAYSGRVLFCAETAGRREVLLQLFNSIKLKPKTYGSWHEFLIDKEAHGITVAPLDEGLTLLDPSLTVIAETQLYGKRVMQRRRRKVTTQDTEEIVKDLAELQIGSPIVHIDHGIGRYLGLQTLTVGEQIAEFLTLEYADNTKLYVPVSSIHLISRYSGAEPGQAPLHKLGTEQWQRAKRKTAEQVRDVAAELLEIYAQRAARPGLSCKNINGEYEAFAAAFPFEETPDQQQAIDNVINDMLSDKPMDRLVCGDVGFGKTEVAMRAAFMAVQNGKQVALLVPTTLLAQQHYQNFLDRFADWPIRIESMSRFRTGKEQQGTLERLQEGKVDIVIGTHKLLQKPYLTSLE